MIPYDDLVTALASWRARQGLPAVQLSGPLTTTPAPRRAAPVAAPIVASPRGAPPAPPGRGFKTTPPPLAPADPVDVDDASLIEAQFENQGDDFAMAFGLSSETESTAIGFAPRQSDTMLEAEPAPDFGLGAPGATAAKPQRAPVDDVVLGSPGRTPRRGNNNDR